MNKYSIINLKTDPTLKKRAAETAHKLGVSISAVLNNELQRFVTEQRVVFEIPEVPNTKTAKILDSTEERISKGEVYTFTTNEDALDFLAGELG